MLFRYRLSTAALATLLVATAFPAAAQTEPAVDPHEHCRKLCAQFYVADAEKRALCESGCGDARDCAARCAGRLPNDAEKRARCTARCARSR
jgi:hypothetical protein